MEPIQTETDVRWDLVIVLDLKDVLGVEGFEPVWRQAAADERGQVVEALLQVVHGILSGLKDLLVVPDVRVQAQVLNMPTFVMFGWIRLPSE